MSRAIRPSKQTLLRTRYTLFCIFRWRRLPRSTALEVAGNSLSSRNVRAFSRCGEKTFFKVSPIHVKPFDPLAQLLQLAQGRLRPATPVKQRVDVLHDLAQFAQMRQATGDVQEPLAFAWLQTTFDKQKAILEHVTDFGLDHRVGHLV